MKQRKKRSTLNRRLQKAILSLMSALCIAAFFWLTSTVSVVPQPSITKPTELYSNQLSHDLRSTFSQAIRDAQKSVFLTIYSLTDRTLINDLRNKSEEGVDVTVIYDHQASAGVHKKLGQKVKATSRKGRGLMHQKILVVDDVKSWIGSANFTPTSLRSYGNLVTGFYCSELANALQRKAAALANEGKYSVTHPSEHIISGQKVELWFLPDASDAIDRVKNMIRTATKTIKIAMFTWTRQDFANEVIKANKKGVDVEVVIDRNSGQGASSIIVELLRVNRLKVRVSQGSELLHHKFMIVDDQVLINGSANWTKAAFTQNDDCFIILHDLNDEQRIFLDRLWKVIINESDLVDAL